MEFDYFEKLCFWCSVQASLFRKNQNIPLRQGEIWWCNLGMNVGEESYGKGSRFTRPVLVFKKLSSNSFLGLPATTKRKDGSWYVQIGLDSTPRWIMLNQARILDRKRLIEYIGILKIEDFLETKTKFHDLYCL
jgi:mRNA interferase MazF